ncbi:hypothetical protein [Photorhabdus sp. P32]|uniref:hypothetical protein n=1 Tax=Photorhabdus sp. P32 TaxID=3117549 RepID=UPI00311B250E
MTTGTLLKSGAPFSLSEPTALSDIGGKLLMDRKMLRARQLQANKPVLPGHARYRLEIRRCKAALIRKT